MKERLAKIAIVIPVHNRKEKTLNCLHQLRLINKSGIDISTVVVDDGSTDGTTEAINNMYPEVVVLHGNGNLWWSGATNMGVVWALEHDSDYVLTLNDDIIFDNEMLVNLLGASKSNSNSMSCGVVCDMRNNKIISAGKYTKGILKSEYIWYLAGSDISCLPKKEYKMGIGCGCAVLYPIDIFKEIGLFDYSKFPHHMGDMDFILRARKRGFEIFVNPKVIIYTSIGDNYFHNQIVNGSTLSNIKGFIDIKSTANLQTRLKFYLRHTPYYLGFLSFIFFIMKMTTALALKIILPHKILHGFWEKRNKVKIYQNNIK